MKKRLISMVCLLLVCILPFSAMATQKMSLQYSVGEMLETMIPGITELCDTTVILAEESEDGVALALSMKDEVKATIALKAAEDGLYISIPEVYEQPYFFSYEDIAVVVENFANDMINIYENIPEEERAEMIDSILTTLENLASEELSDFADSVEQLSKIMVIIEQASTTETGNFTSESHDEGTNKVTVALNAKEIIEIISVLYPSAATDEDFTNNITNSKASVNVTLISTETDIVNVKVEANAIIEENKEPVAVVFENNNLTTDGVKTSTGDLKFIGGEELAGVEVLYVADENNMVVVANLVEAAFVIEVISDEKDAKLAVYMAEQNADLEVNTDELKLVYGVEVKSSEGESELLKVLDGANAQDSIQPLKLATEELEKNIETITINSIQLGMEIISELPDEILANFIEVDPTTTDASVATTEVAE